MEITWKKVQSKQKPTEIDITSSPNGVYYRRNIQKLTKENESGEISVYYEYEESFMTMNEWEEYQITVEYKKFNDEENSLEFEEFSNKLRTGVEYKNGKSYKPIWHKLYSSIIDEFEPKINLYKLLGGDITAFTSIKTAVYDITGKAANIEMMSILEAIELWKFLYMKKEEFYNEYKLAKELKNIA